jgi:hypothetical protein
MKELTQVEKDRLWDEVRGEFPEDEMMQQVHFVRLVHYYQTRGLSARERVRYWGRARQVPIPARGPS